MPEQPGQLCEVGECPQPAAGSYLHLAGDRTVQFAVCDPHLAQLKAGARPTVKAAGFDLAEPDARPTLLLEPAGHPGGGDLRTPPRIPGGE